jgi:hypothetical protein
MPANADTGAVPMHLTMRGEYVAVWQALSLPVAPSTLQQEELGRSFRVEQIVLIPRV